MPCCKNCGKVLTADEVALNKKLINRGAVEFLCINCLGEYFDCSVDVLNRKIKEFKEMGCTLFASQ
jgi:hypothetical protein